MASRTHPAFKSLIYPNITVTSPSGFKTRPSKSAVHPSTSYEMGGVSGVASANESGDEERVSEIQKAQRLSFATTPIMSDPGGSRTMRMIYRGEYLKIVQEAGEDQHLNRYLVATDLSDESTHALEWAIGTVLRDGDTLYATYCIDEDDIDEAQEGKRKGSGASVEATGPTPAVSGLPGFPGSRLSFSAVSDREKGGEDAGAAGQESRGFAERQRATQNITNKVIKLLRRTRLQVQVLIEVMHCKSPKHVITEIIDSVKPSLVILGSRGRSALKG